MSTLVSAGFFRNSYLSTATGLTIIDFQKRTDFIFIQTLIHNTNKSKQNKKGLKVQLVMKFSFLKNLSSSLSFSLSHSETVRFFFRVSRFQSQSFEFFFQREKKQNDRRRKFLPSRENWRLLRFIECRFSTVIEKLASSFSSALESRRRKKPPLTTKGRTWIRLVFEFFGEMMNIVENPRVVPVVRPLRRP